MSVRPCCLVKSSCTMVWEQHTCCLDINPVSVGANAVATLSLSFLDLICSQGLSCRALLSDRIGHPHRMRGRHLPGGHRRF